MLMIRCHVISKRRLKSTQQSSPSNTQLLFRLQLFRLQNCVSYELYDGIEIDSLFDAIDVICPQEMNSLTSRAHLNVLVIVDIFDNFWIVPSAFLLRLYK